MFYTNHIVLIVSYPSKPFTFSCMISYLITILVLFVSLQVVHVAIGIVRSNLVLTLVQVTSRVVVVWMVMAGFPQVSSYQFLFFFTYTLLDIQ